MPGGPGVRAGMARGLGFTPVGPGILELAKVITPEGGGSVQDRIRTAGRRQNQKFGARLSACTDDAAGYTRQRQPSHQGARPIPITRRYHSWKCCMPSSIGLW